MDTFAPRPFERGKRGNYENRRDEVLRAAARIFAEFGFQRATLEHIARELNITRPALYHYAKSKEELVTACAVRARDELQRVLVSARAETTGRLQLIAFFRAYLLIICDNFGRCFVVVSSGELSPDDAAINTDSQRRLDAGVRGMVAQGVLDGSLGDVSPKYVTRALFATFNGVPAWYRSSGPDSLAEIADRLLLVVLNGISASPVTLVDLPEPAPNA